jgi:hypothetical protein
VLIVAAAFIVPLLAVLPVEAVEIPRMAHTHKRLLLQQSRLVWGLDAPTATFAAQIHQESLWRENAVSHVGAQGLAQFMPKTGAWIVTVYRDLGTHEPMNPTWSIRAMAQYNLHLHHRVDGSHECERWAKTLSAYNGGLTWISRDEKLAASEGYDPTRWFDNVELVNSGRSAANFKENRGYPRRILLMLESVYIAAGFGGGVCDGYSPSPSPPTPLPEDEAIEVAEAEVEEAPEAEHGFFRALWEKILGWFE